MQYQDLKTTIIGAGPGGASAAIYLARYIHQVTLVDAGVELPGRTSMAEGLENFLTHSGVVSGQNFMEKISNQLSEYALINRVNEKVVKASKENDCFVVETISGQKIESQFLIVAVGVEDVMPEIDGLDPYFEHSICHCILCDWYRHRDKKILLVGDDDEVIKIALALKLRYPPQSVGVIPAKQPVFSPQLVERANSENVKVYHSPLAKLSGQNGYLQEVVLENGEQILAEVLFTNLGHKPLTNFIDPKTLSAAQDEFGFLKVDFRTFETTVPNFYAVGPCNEGGDQIVVAAGEGALAAQDIHKKILTLFDL